MSEYSGSVQDVVEGLFRDYSKFWSLADTRYSGTLTLIHKRLHFTGSDATVAFTPESSIRLLLNHYNLTRQDVGLDTITKKSSEQESCEQRQQQSPMSMKAKKQTSVMSFFSVKKKSGGTTKSSSSSSSGSISCQLLDHQSEGRFQFFFFPNMDIIQTYVPNNGMKDESFAKRRQWDKQMQDFFVARSKILKYVSEKNKSTQALGDHQGLPLQQQQQQQHQRPILWCGDLNVARDYRDGTHWTQKDDGTIEEWWTDESKCLVASDKKSSAVNKSWDDTGIPSFTPAERRRFEDLIRTADLIDIWRDLHPNGVDHKPGQPDPGVARMSSFSTEWEKPNYTWRGHLSKNRSYQAKYQGKGQRLDYFLLSPSSLSKEDADVVESCEILGYGEQRLGLFCGSDHCASLLKLRTEL